MSAQAPSIDDFLSPLSINTETVDSLSRHFLHAFDKLAAESQNQFLPTPISEAILRPEGNRAQGCHLAMDIGGTNLRVGFVELQTKSPPSSQDNQSDVNLSLDVNGTTQGRMNRLLERSWPIDEHLKNQNPDSLFLWIGKCIAQVVSDGCETLGLPTDQLMPLGVTFSFPMIQHSLSKATLMSMGKGFAISSDLDLGDRLIDGYNRGKPPGLPRICVKAIANDSVSTLVSFIFNHQETTTRHAAMGLILGTGCNATIPLKMNQLHPSKRPRHVLLRPGEAEEEAKITINTEWSINGTAPPLHQVGLVSKWDKVLDSQNESPGFQPLEYMTAGRYLGELGRTVLVDYLTESLGIAAGKLPQKLLRKDSLTTTFLSNFKPLEAETLLASLQKEFPVAGETPSFEWTKELAVALYRIAKAIEIRAAGIVAAATVALLTLAGDIPRDGVLDDSVEHELGVGYTGGCIVHFQDYLKDCQTFLDRLMEKRSGGPSKLRVVLSPCHDGGITGAGILVAATFSSLEKGTK